MYFKSCLWVLHSCAASGENRGRSCDSEVKSRIHLPSLRCPALSCLGHNWSLWLCLQPLEGADSCQGWLTWGFEGTNTASPVLVGMASSSQSDLADSPGLLLCAWGTAETNYCSCAMSGGSLGTGVWAPHCLCPVCSSSLPWSLIPISYLGSEKVGKGSMQARICLDYVPL